MVLAASLEFERGHNSEVKPNFFNTMTKNKAYNLKCIVYLFRKEDFK